MITGDDILIEYVTRLVDALSFDKVSEGDLGQDHRDKIEKFITHYVWYQQDKGGSEESAKASSQPGNQPGLTERLQNRLNEMLERRRRLLKQIFKNEGKFQKFHEQFPTIIQRKKEVIQKFEAIELEHLLSNSTKNVAQEVVGCLIPAKGKGILNQLEQS